MGPETLFKLLLATLKPGVQRLIVDVGANQGTFSLLAAKQGHRVIAFEPLPNNINAFRHYLPNAAYPQVRLVTKGVGAASAGRVQMRGNWVGTSSSGVEKGTSVDVGATVTANCDPTRTRCHEVSLTSLDAEVQEPVFVMKLDIQGFETHALRGGRRLLRERGVDYLIVEFDPRLQSAQGGSCLTILRELRAAGYVLFEGARLAFDAKRRLDRVYSRNWGGPQPFASFVDSLRKEGSYTDLLAVRRELVAQTFFA
jgi:FkbM family methyltransferase